MSNCFGALLIGPNYWAVAYFFYSIGANFCIFSLMQMAFAELTEEAVALACIQNSFKAQPRPTPAEPYMLQGSVIGSTLSTMGKH